MDDNESVKRSVDGLLVSCKVLAGHNPSRYGWLYARSDEVCVGLQLILENYYLKKYGALSYELSVY